MESAYNRSIKRFFGLPFGTHRYLIEPLTGTQHPKKVLMKRYLSFIGSIAKSSKPALRQLLNLVKNDVRSNTGENLRRIMIALNEKTIDDIKSVGVRPQR